MGSFEFVSFRFRRDVRILGKEMFAVLVDLPQDQPSLSLLSIPTFENHFFEVHLTLQVFFASQKTGLIMAVTQSGHQLISVTKGYHYKSKIVTLLLS